MLNTYRVMVFIRYPSDSVVGRESGGSDNDMVVLLAGGEQQ